MSEIARMLDKGFNPTRLARAAHEAGHGRYFVQHGIKVDHVSLSGTKTRKGQEFSGSKRKHYLIAGAAGPAALYRFLKVHCGYSSSKARSFAYDDSESDQKIFDHWRKEWGISMSFGSAFSTGCSWANSNGGSLDRLTARLAKNGSISTFWDL